MRPYKDFDKPETKIELGDDAWAWRRNTDKTRLSRWSELRIRQHLKRMFSDVDDVAVPMLEYLSELEYLRVSWRIRMLSTEDNLERLAILQSQIVPISKQIGDAINRLIPHVRATDSVNPTAHRIERFRLPHDKRP